jgi:hypothetical protein
VSTMAEGEPGCGQVKLEQGPGARHGKAAMGTKAGLEGRGQLPENDGRIQARGRSREAAAQGGESREEQRRSRKMATAGEESAGRERGEREDG